MSRGPDGEPVVRILKLENGVPLLTSRVKEKSDSSITFEYIFREPVTRHDIETSDKLGSDRMILENLQKRGWIDRDKKTIPPVESMKMEIMETSDSREWEIRYSI